MKTPYDFLARLAPKPTPEEEAAAQKLGVTIQEYQAAKLEVLAEQARLKAGIKDDRPADIAAEEAITQRLRRQPGLIKPRNVQPNLVVQAMETPGEVARLILFVFCYLVAMAALVIFGGEKVRNMPGIFQCLVLGVMIFPVKWASDRLWEMIGEGARDFCRALVRFWPVTLLGLIFVLGLIKMLLAGGAQK